MAYREYIFTAAFTYKGNDLKRMHTVHRRWYTIAIHSTRIFSQCNNYVVNMF